MNTSKGWPIAAAMLGFPSSHSASPEIWRSQLAEVAFEGFTEVDVMDSWVRVGDLDPVGLAELGSALSSTGLRPEAVSAIRRSVIDPDSGDDNLDYSHRTIDAAASLGCSIVSVGLHRPLTPAQRAAYWFWTVDGPKDEDTKAVWDLAVTRLRELGRHAEEVGLKLSLEMYEDTLLGSAESAVRLVKDIDQTVVGLNPDLGNLFRLHRETLDVNAALALCLPVSNYWHVKNYYRDVNPATGAVVTVPAPMASGSMDYRSAIRTAIALGYRAPFCVEHYGGDSLTVMSANRRYLRTVLASIEEATLDSDPGRSTFREDRMGDRA
jgi:sugar phosphate isomerase/epimerase